MARAFPQQSNTPHRMRRITIAAPCFLALVTPALLTLGTEAQIIQNSSFETPLVGLANNFWSFQYNPTGAVWTFSCNAGIAANGSGMMYYAPHPICPDGNQFAFLQGSGGIGGSISQVFSNSMPGTFAFSFFASQRESVGASFESQEQTITVLVDGISVGSFTPADTNWYSFQTTPIPLVPGNHFLTFTNLPVAGDATAFVDSIGVSQFTNSAYIAFSGSIQTWIVPQAGLYQITAFGAQGGNSASDYGAMLGGLGAEVSGEFNLTAGEVLNIVVGGQGNNGAAWDPNTYSCGAGGGGGGTFVYGSTELLEVAGGGGGGGQHDGGVPGPASATGTSGDWTGGGRREPRFRRARGPSPVHLVGGYLCRDSRSSGQWRRGRRLV